MSLEESKHGRKLDLNSRPLAKDQKITTEVSLKLNLLKNQLSVMLNKFSLSGKMVWTV